MLTPGQLRRALTYARESGKRYGRLARDVLVEPGRAARLFPLPLSGRRGVLEEVTMGSGIPADPSPEQASQLLDAYEASYLAAVVGQARAKGGWYRRKPARYHRHPSHPYLHPAKRRHRGR